MLMASGHAGGEAAMKEIPAKTLLSANRNPGAWFDARYTLNIYRGCCHGCIYCDSRSDCYRVENFDEVAVKKDVLALLEQELRRRRTRGIIGMGAMRDPYNPFEAEKRLTRGSLKLMDRYGFGVHLVTKSPLVTRDADVLKAIQEHDPVNIAMTITASSDDLARKIEPGAPTSSQRFRAVAGLAAEGLVAGILLMPVLPFITDDERNILAIVERAADSGAAYVYPFFGVTLRSGQREYFYRALDRLFPGLREKYACSYGMKYSCWSEHSRRLREVFREACEKKGLLCTMADIIQLSRSKVVQKQQTLFG